MNEFLFSLGGATLFLGGGFCATTVLLRTTRCRSWRLRRVAWAVVLLLGVVPLIGLTWTLKIPLQNTEPANRHPRAGGDLENRFSIPLHSTKSPDKMHYSEPRTSGSGSDVRMKNEITVSECNVDNELQEQRVQEKDEANTLGPRLRGDDGVQSVTKMQTSVTFVVFTIWLLGVLTILFRTFIHSLRFHRSLRDAQPAETEWSEPWNTLQAEHGMKRPIPMLASDTHGPALIRQWFGFVFVVPLEGWEGLSEAERRSVMLHELEHYRRADIWTSAAARLVALIHWFNPAAWGAVRRFEEAAEWACDDAAVERNGESLPFFAKALVSLHESAVRRPTVTETVFQYNIFGRDISYRVSRLLRFEHFHQRESIMKRAFLLTVVALLFCTAWIRVQLVAQNPTQNPKKEPGTERIAVPGLPDSEKAAENPEITANTPSSPALAQASPSIDELQEKVVELKKKKATLDKLYEQKAISAKEVYEAEQELQQAYRVHSDAVVKSMKRDPAQLESLFKELEEARKNYLDVHAKYVAGQRGGTTGDHVDAQLKLADAEILLYRFTEETDRLLAALQTRVDAARERAKWSVTAVKAGLKPASDTPEVEKKLANAEAELKAEQAMHGPPRKLGENAKPLADASGSAALDKDYLALLQKRVEMTKRIMDQVLAMNQAGAPGGKGTAFPDAQIKHTSALVDLYRYTGQQEKLLEAVAMKYDAAKAKHQICSAGYKAGTVTLDVLSTAELELAETEYELKAAKLSTKEPGTERSAVPGPIRGLRSTSIPGSLEGKKPLLFQGKTFEQWVDDLQTDLDPKVRGEAFRALAMFGANGRGKEAAEIILDAVKGIDYDQRSNEPLQSMKESALLAFTDKDVRIPFKVSLPLLMQKFVDGDAREQSFVKNFLMMPLEVFDKEQFSFCYDKLMQWDLSDPKDERPCVLFGVLARTENGEMLLKFLKETIKNQDAPRFALYFKSFTSKFYPDKSSNGYFFGLYPQVIELDHQGVGPRKLNKLTDFGKSLLTLLEECGVTSANETIRETSTKVVASLKSVEEKPEKSGPQVPAR